MFTLCAWVPVGLYFQGFRYSFSMAYLNKFFLLFISVPLPPPPPVNIIYFHVNIFEEISLQINKNFSLPHHPRAWLHHQTLKRNQFPRSIARLWKSLKLGHADARTGLRWWKKLKRWEAERNWNTFSVMTGESRLENVIKRRKTDSSFVLGRVQSSHVNHWRKFKDNTSSRRRKRTLH